MLLIFTQNTDADRKLPCGTPTFADKNQKMWVPPELQTYLVGPVILRQSQGGKFVCKIIQVYYKYLLSCFVSFIYKYKALDYSNLIMIL